MPKIVSFSLLFFKIIFFSSLLSAQTEEDKSALKNIIVEKYYEATSQDIADTTGGILQEGAITYRIYVDLKPGYTLQAVYGVPKHELRIETTTEFFNSRNGNITGDKIETGKINEHNLVLDSWVTIGAATSSLLGVPKEDDKDGSIIERKSLNKEDGLTKGKITPITFFGLDLIFFHSAAKPKIFSSTNGSWAAFGGVKSPAPENKILIAQLTTNGKLSFELNIQIGTPAGGTINYVAKNPSGSEIKFDALSYPLKH